MEGQHSTWSSQEGVGRGEVEMNILVAAVPAECARGDQARDPRELATDAAGTCVIAIICVQAHP